MATVNATVTATSPLAIAIPGDPPGHTIPARNASGLTLAIDDKVKVNSLPGGRLPEITGRLS